MSCCYNDYVADVPSAEPDSCCDRARLLYQKNRTLAIFLIVALTLVILGVVFIIVWFGFLKHSSSSSSAQVSHFSWVGDVHYLHLRH